MATSKSLQCPIIATTNLYSEFYEENRLQKLTRRLKEEPLIPFGTPLFPNPPFPPPSSPSPYLPASLAISLFTSPFPLP
jgi:hypothetical protein